MQGKVLAKGLPKLSSQLNDFSRTLILQRLAVEARNKLFDALVKPVLLYGCEIRGPELLSYKTHFDKSRIEQVHIKFCKQTLNVPWHTENTACKEELGRYPLSIDIKASLLCYWQKIRQTTL